MCLSTSVVSSVIAASFALAAYARRSKREPKFIIDLGLAYMLFMALAMGQLFHWVPMHANASPPPQSTIRTSRGSP